MKSLIFSVLIFAMFPIITYGNIDIVCNYTNIPPDHMNELKKIGLDKEISAPIPWWQFWNKGKTIMFSINPITGQVTNQLPIMGEVESISPSDLFIADVFPNFIVLHGAPTIQSAQNEDDEWTFDIDRTTGELDGTRYAYDNSYMPEFKAGDILWYVTGQCGPIKRIF